MNLVWHYTIKNRFNTILSDGFIRPADAGVPLTERPVVWFSAQPFWEPTANKIMQWQDGYTKLLTSQEMIDNFKLYRFGMDRGLLLPWAQLKRKARISTKEQRAMVASAKAVKADPMLWYGSLEAVPVHETVIQELNKDTSTWEDPDESDV